MARLPRENGTSVDNRGRPALGADCQAPTLFWSKPLGDPFGGTDLANGRHPVKMIEPRAADGTPDEVVYLILGSLQFSDACLRAYGHPDLLAVAAAINGEDFVPFTDAIFIKEPGLGASVAWHQDGTTHWDAADWDHGAHGFNFMAQLHPSTAGNGVWVLPGSHKQGKVDIKQMVADSGSERIEGAVPLLCGAGDVFICNRQLVHGSFANSSPDRRITLNAGFFPRSRVLDVTTSKLDNTEVTYTAEKIHERCRIIALGVDARQQRFPEEPRYNYQPLAGQEDDNRWNEQTRETLIRDYNLQDFYI
jgi:hypothetical protein